MHDVLTQHTSRLEYALFVKGTFNQIIDAYQMKSVAVVKFLRCVRCINTGLLSFHKFTLISHFMHLQRTPVYSPQPVVYLEEEVQLVVRTHNNHKLYIECFMLA